MAPSGQDSSEGDVPKPFVEERQARATAEAYLRARGDHDSQLFPGTVSELPRGLYGPLPDEPCWAFHVDEWSKRGVFALDSTRLLFVSKLSGRVVFDGKAADEG